MNAFEQPSMAERKETSEIKLERLLAAGNFYGSLLEHLTGRRAEFDPDILKNADSRDREFLTKIREVADAHLVRMHDEKERQGITAEDLLKIAAKSQPRAAEALAALKPEALSRVRLDEPSPGVYVLYIPDAEFSSMFPGAQALAYQKNIPPFMVFMELTRTDANAREAYLQENLPHELHHIIWKKAQKEGLVTNAEKETAAKHSFGMYQDELLAKASSGGAIIGYDLFVLIKNSHGKEALRQMLIEEGIKEEEVVAARDKFIRNNDILEELRPMMAEREIDAKALVPIIARATTYEELESGLLDFRAMIESLPVTKPPIQHG